MESLYLLIPIALIVVVLAIKLLFWAINNGQYDNLNTEGHRILFDEPVDKLSSTESNESANTHTPASELTPPSNSNGKN